MTINIDEKLKEFRLNGLIKNIGAIRSDRVMLANIQKFLEWEVEERLEKKLNASLQKTCLKKQNTTSFF